MRFAYGDYQGVHPKAAPPVEALDFLDAIRARARVLGFRAMAVVEERTSCSENDLKRGKAQVRSRVTSKVRRMPNLKLYRATQLTAHLTSS